MRYYLQVEGFTTSEGAYELRMSSCASPPPSPAPPPAPPSPSPGACTLQGALDVNGTLSCANGGFVTGSTVGVPSRFGSLSGDHFYKIIGTGLPMTFDTCGSNFDTFLRLVNGCHPALASWSRSTMMAAPPSEAFMASRD